MYHFYMMNRPEMNRPEFLQHYHKRSNVETTFHMIKSKVWSTLAESDTDRAGQRSLMQGALSQPVRSDSIGSRIGNRNDFWGRNRVCPKTHVNLRVLRQSPMSVISQDSLEAHARAVPYDCGSVTVTAFLLQSTVLGPSKRRDAASTEGT